jgi:hypothetical protein
MMPAQELKSGSIAFGIAGYAICLRVACDREFSQRWAAARSTHQRRRNNLLLIEGLQQELELSRSCREIFQFNSLKRTRR